MAYILKSLFRKIRFCCIQMLYSKTLLNLGDIDNLCILAPHPDDETMGCGQLIAACHRNNKDCKVIVISKGNAAHRQCCTISEQELTEKRRESCLKAMEVLGIEKKQVVFLDFPDGELLRYEDEIVKAVKQELKQTNYTLFVPHEREGWNDHLAIYHVGQKMATSTGCKVYAYCVWFYFSMPFRAFNKVPWRTAVIFHDDDGLIKKQTALSVYQNEKAPCGKPYAGVLPALLWKAVNSYHEIFFQL